MALFAFADSDLRADTDIGVGADAAALRPRDSAPKRGGEARESGIDKYKSEALPVFSGGASLCTFI